MAKRSSKAEGVLLLLAVIVGIPIYLATKLLQVTGWVLPLAVIVTVVALAWWIQHARIQRRLAYLRSKYHDEDVVQKIFGGQVWHGQTHGQLQDALGPPAAIDNKLLKTMTRQVWKYHPSGVNRYRLRITLDNGHVAAWDQKE